MKNDSHENLSEIIERGIKLPDGLVGILAKDKDGKQALIEEGKIIYGKHDEVGAFWKTVDKEPLLSATDNENWALYNKKGERVYGEHKKLNGRISGRFYQIPGVGNVLVTREPSEEENKYFIWTEDEKQVYGNDGVYLRINLGTDIKLPILETPDGELILETIPPDGWTYITKDGEEVYGKGNYIERFKEKDGEILAVSIDEDNDEKIYIKRDGKIIKTNEKVD